ncbi:hypothetical protein SASPL_105178 [Salvia splendens]|uniref:Uncharacterized protein n=1 Tax=Salvia splendens TaxID=180675 RepID=A0A8X8YKL1_SALSN|nr:hypothetical protein SASPL_105178 [Salvia splendens]
MHVDPIENDYGDSSQNEEESHPDCTFMRNKLFPYFDQLSFVWGKDRVVGPYAEVVVDMIEDLDGEQNVDQGDEEFGEDGAPSIITPRSEGTSKKT